ncbi:MAG: phage tail protein, partial [Coprobacillus sp.]|nr:phage tail protein [Coprobacillus sp.]
MTNGGAALLTKAQAGECRIEFTRMAIGNGTYTAEEETIAALQERTELKSLKNSYALSGVSVNTEKSVKVSALLSNQDPTTLEPIITEGYYINEIGLYGKEADGGDDTEVLYSIATTAGDQGDYMPPYNGYNPAEILQDFYATVDNSANVTINIQGAALTVEQAEEMKKELEEEIAGIDSYDGE